MRNKVLPLLTNAINPSLSGSNSQINTLNYFICTSPSALIPAKHPFIHWSRFGSCGIPIVCCPPVPVCHQECSIPRLLWWGAGQNGWGELAMPQQHQGSHCPCSTRAWVVPPAQPCSSSQSLSCFICLALPPLQWNKDVLMLAELHTLLPALFLLSFPQKQSQQLVGVWRGWGGQHWVNDPWQRGRAIEKTILNSPLCFFANGFPVQEYLEILCSSSDHNRSQAASRSDALICTVWKAAPNPNKTAVTRMHPSVCILGSVFFQRPSRQQGAGGGIGHKHPCEESVQSHGTKVQAGNQELQLFSME